MIFMQQYWMRSLYILLFMVLHNYTDSLTPYLEIIVFHLSKDLCLPLGLGTGGFDICCSPAMQTDTMLIAY